MVNNECNMVVSCQNTHCTQILNLTMKASQSPRLKLDYFRTTTPTLQACVRYFWTNVYNHCRDDYVVSHAFVDIVRSRAL